MEGVGVRRLAPPADVDIAKRAILHPRPGGRLAHAREPIPFSLGPNLVDSMDRMKARISSGAGFEIANDNAGTASTKTAQSFVRHGASEFLRHGTSVVHGSSVSGSGSKGTVQIETAVGTLAENLDA